jgi:hypothetical protein
VNNIYKGLPEKDAVPFHACIFVSIDCYFLTFLLNKHFEQPRRFTRQIHCGKHRRMQLDATLVTAGNGQEAINERGEPIHFLKHAPDGISVFITATVFLESNLADAPDRCKRCPQLVRRI